MRRRRAARPRPRRERLAAHRELDAARCEPLRDGAEPVALLDAQLGEAVHHRAALAQRRRRRRGSGYSSIMRGARSAGTSTPRSRVARTADVGDRLAALDALVGEGDVGAHLAQRIEKPGAQRVDADAFDHHSRARHEQRRHQRKRRGGRIARHGEIGGAQLGLALRA